MKYIGMAGLLVVLLSLVLFLSACRSSSPQQHTNNTNNTTVTNSTNSTNEETENSSAFKCSRLENICSSYKGQPYIWGDEFGHDQKGGDCSGYVYRVAKRMGKPIPRTTARKYWTLIDNKKKGWKNSRCGHFVWWTLTKDRPYGHIGVMTYHPKFWQSGSSRGVYSRKFFEGSYWVEHFVGSKSYF